MIDNYWYDGQMRKYLVQFMAIFNGLHVKTGDNECGPQMVPVPVIGGSKDRVVAAIASGNTQNRMFSLPIMAANITTLAIEPERRKAPDYIDKRVTMRTGGVFPEDLTTIQRAAPIPFSMGVELSIYASNVMQMHQILEQILVLFNPELYLQVSEGVYDWTRLTSVYLEDISNEENYPAGVDRRIITWTLSFRIPIYLSVPMAIRDEVVKRITIRIADMANIGTVEYDDDGFLLPFGKPISVVTIDTREPVGEQNIPPKQYNDKPPY